MRNILRLFFSAEGINPWTVLLCLVTASVVEGIGFVSLVPLLLVATDTGVGDPSPWLVAARDLAASVGLPLTAGSLIVFFVITVMLKSVLNFFAMQHVGTAVASFSAGLRLHLIRNLFRARWSYLVQHPVGRIANAIGQAGQSGSAYQLAATFFAQTIQTAVYLAVALVVSWRLALAAMVIGALMAWALHFLVRIARKAGWRQTQRTRELVTLLVDSLNNIKPLRAMAKETEFAQLPGAQDRLGAQGHPARGDRPAGAQERQRASGRDLPGRRFLRGDRDLAGADRRAGRGGRPAQAHQQRHRQDPAAVPAGGGDREPLSRGLGIHRRYAAVRRSAISAIARRPWSEAAGSSR